MVWLEGSRWFSPQIQASLWTFFDRKLWNKSTDQCISYIHNLSECIFEKVPKFLVKGQAKCEMGDAPNTKCVWMKGATRVMIVLLVIRDIKIIKGHRLWQSNTTIGTSPLLKVIYGNQWAIYTMAMFISPEVFPASPSAGESKQSSQRSDCERASRCKQRAMSRLGHEKSGIPETNGNPWYLSLEKALVNHRTFYRASVFHSTRYITV